MKLRVSIGILAVIVIGVLAINETAAAEVYSERTLELARKLQCPVCTGESVAESQAAIARQMRDTIELKVRAGETDEEILAYFVDRYGEKVLSEPPKEGFHLTLWWLPVIFVAIAGMVVVLFLRDNLRTPRKRTAGEGNREDAELEAIARDVLNPNPGGRAK